MAVARLRTFLASLPNGEVDASHLDDAISLLADAWDSLGNSGLTGMKADKIRLGRVEELYWESPLLSFKIERHGATVNGSSRAHLYCWRVDVANAIASVGHPVMRQKQSRSNPLDVGILAQVVFQLIRAGVDDDEGRLTWKNDSRVKVNVAAVIPDKGPVQTTQGRRKRFRLALDALTAQEGWRRVPSGTQLVYEKCCSS